MGQGQVWEKMLAVIFLWLYYKLKNTATMMSNLIKQQTESH